MKVIHTTELFNDWFVGLRDPQAKRRIQARIDRARTGAGILGGHYGNTQITQMG
jgi:putative component of toxin-antitoxin plasmid stabilization module